MKSKYSRQNLLRFVVVGVATAVLFYVLVWTLYAVVGLNGVLASGTSSVIITVFNYQMHYTWTFQADAPHGQAFTRYLVMTGSGISLNAIIMYIGVDVLAYHLLIAQTVGAVVMISWNMFWSAVWVYRD